MDKQWHSWKGEDNHPLFSSSPDVACTPAVLFTRMMHAGVQIPIESGDGRKFWSMACSVVDSRLLPGDEQPSRAPSIPDELK